MQRLPILVIVLGVLGAVCPAYGADVEYRVKGGYLYNFTKFVEWPTDTFSDPQSPIVISILGDDPFGHEFDEAMKGEVSQGRKIKIQRINRVEEAAGSHVLFICRSENRNLPEILKQLRGSSILTVGEGNHFAAEGGIIEFVIANGKVRFVINASAEKRARLKINAQLKAIATDVLRD